MITSWPQIEDQWVRRLLDTLREMVPPSVREGMPSCVENAYRVHTFVPLARRLDMALAERWTASDSDPAGRLVLLLALDPRAGLRAACAMAEVLATPGDEPAWSHRARRVAYAWIAEDASTEDVTQAWTDAKWSICTLDTPALRAALDLIGMVAEQNEGLFGYTLKARNFVLNILLHTCATVLQEAKTMQAWRVSYDPVINQQRATVRRRVAEARQVAEDRRDRMVRDARKELPSLVPLVESVTG